MKMGLIGVSILVASGDAGTTGELAVGQAEAVIPFQAGYPASSPYITCVGATEFANPTFTLKNPPPVCNDSRLGECATGGDEQSVSAAIAGYTAGGGFSDVDARPAYQTDAVAAYLRSGVALPLNRSWFNASTRGLPDVTCIGYDAFVVNGGRWALESGTSQSTPIFAGIVALLQADYHAITNSTLGFLNTMLYKAQAAGKGLFRDIVVGDNCQTRRCLGTQDGFLATKGWDPVTGLGAPVYPAMKAYVEELAEVVVHGRKTSGMRAAWE